jgi:hypothetical protein
MVWLHLPTYAQVKELQQDDKALFPPSPPSVMDLSVLDNRARHCVEPNNLAQKRRTIMTRSSYSLQILCASTAILVCAQTSLSSALEKLTGTREQLQILAGTYVDPEARDWGQGTFGKREFTFDDGKWTLTFVLALDPKMEQRVFEFRTLGSYKVGAGSKAVAGAFETDFDEDSKFLTLFTDNADLSKSFGLSDCGLKSGEEKDISETGCSLWKPVSVCGTDHDLLALDEKGQVYFGVRPPDNDMCTPDKRPNALLPAVVKN